MIMASGRINPAETGYVHVMIKFSVKDAKLSGAIGLECAIMFMVKAREITYDDLTESKNPYAARFHTPGYQYINHRNPTVLVVKPKKSFWDWLFGK